MNTIISVLLLLLLLTAATATCVWKRNMRSVWFVVIASAITMICALIFIGAWGCSHHWSFALVVVAIIYLIALTVGQKCFIVISPSPPEVAAQIIWKKRTGRTVKEGITFYAPFFPFFLDYIRIGIVKKNEDLAPIKVWCKKTPDETDSSNSAQMGAQLEVVISLTWTPDPCRLDEFIDSGLDVNVMSILKEKIEENLRQIAQEELWEDFLHMSKKTTEATIRLLTGQERTSAIVNGLADVKNLGILLYRLNVKKIDIVDDELKKSVTAFSREQRERQAEEYEMKTEINQAKMLVSAAKTQRLSLSISQAFSLIKKFKLIREGKLQGKNYSFDGLEGLPQILAAIIKREG